MGAFHVCRVAATRDPLRLRVRIADNMPDEHGRHSPNYSRLP